MTYTLDQALRARSVLRSAAGLGEERFDDAELVNMLTDEIRALREQGTTDEDIVETLRSRADVSIDASALSRAPGN